MSGWLALGVSVAFAVLVGLVFWFRRKAKKAGEVAILKEAERDREQREHEKTLKQMRVNAESFITEAGRKQEVLAKAEARLLEARRERARALSGDDLLAAGNRLWGNEDEDGVR